MSLHGWSALTAVAYAAATVAVALWSEAGLSLKQVFASEPQNSRLCEMSESSPDNHCIEGFPQRHSGAPSFAVPTFPDALPASLESTGRPLTHPSVRTSAGPKRVLLFFTASWCGPCQQMKPIVDRLKEEGLTVQIVDVDQDRKLTKEHDVSSIPHFVMVVDGKSIEEISGTTNERSLRRLLQLRERRLLPVAPVYTVSGSISDTRLLSVLPVSGIVRDAQDWADLCEAWHLDPRQNEVDFQTEFVVVKTSSGSSMSVTLVIDRHGDLTCNGIYTADHCPNGFKFVAVVVNRKGIRTIHGEPLVSLR